MYFEESNSSCGSYDNTNRSAVQLTFKQLSDLWNRVTGNFTQITAETQAKQLRKVRSPVIRPKDVHKQTTLMSELLKLQINTKKENKAK